MRTALKLFSSSLRLVLCSTILLAGCQTGVSGNDNGSDPVNEQETIEYKKAVVRCYKTGGTRVVKIMGQLRCY